MFGRRKQFGILDSVQLSTQINPGASSVAIKFGDEAHGPWRAQKCKTFDDYFYFMIKPNYYY